MIFSDDPTFAPIDFVLQIFDWFNANPIFIWLFSAFTSLMIIRIWRVALSPYCYFKDENGESIYLGRFVSQEKDPDFPNYWKLMFKHNQINIVRCKYSFTEVRDHTYLSFGILKYFSDIIYRETKLDDSLKFPEQERVKSKSNTAKYVIYRILSAILPSTSISRKLYLTIEFQDKLDNDGNPILINKIHTLQHQLLFDRIRTVAQKVTYRKKIIDEKQGMIVKERKAKNLTLFEIEDLKRDKNVKTGSIKATHFKHKIIKTRNLNEAILKQPHIDNLKSLMDLKVAKITKQYIELDKKYNQARDQIAEMFRNFNSKLGDMAVKVNQASVMHPDTYAEILSTAFKGKREDKEIKTIISEVLAQNSEDTQELRNQMNYLMAENNILKEKLGGNGDAKKLNQIVIRDELEGG
ncbi:MAG: hypothetical protein U9Q73_01945 [Nanoarchaeota archaeon]|nr:hypothetical protein [Nanoarchaeota archaeon]